MKDSNDSHKQRHPLSLKQRILLEMSADKKVGYMLAVYDMALERLAFFSSRRTDLSAESVQQVMAFALRTGEQEIAAAYQEPRP